MRVQESDSKSERRKGGAAYPPGDHPAWGPDSEHRDGITGIMLIAAPPAGNSGFKFYRDDAIMMISSAADIRVRAMSLSRDHYDA
eukprot:787939-Rhodomonas_salina.1